MRARRAGVAVIGVGLLLGGCATIPQGGAVHVAHVENRDGTVDEPDSRVLPPGPTEGQAPPDVVRGFINASASADNAYAIARSFLTRAVGKAWQAPRAVIVYDEGSLQANLSGRVVTVTVNQVGRIDARGGFSLASGSLSFQYPVTKDRGEWRIATPPEQLLLSEADVRRSFRSVDIYFVNPSDQVVVPDRVYLQSSRRDLPTRLAERLLSGPSSWLAPAVRTAFPAGTKLTGRVDVRNGMATVPLSRQALRANASQRRAMSAQLVWTLKQLTDMSGLEILAGGAPLDVPGQGAPQSRDDWPSYDPDVLDSDAAVYYSRDGSVRSPVDNPAAGAAGAAQIDNGKVLRSVPNVPLRHPVVAGGRLAALGPVPDGVGLYTGALSSGPLAVVWRAAAMTPPAFDVRGRLWTVVTDAAGKQRVLVVPQGGRPTYVPAPDLAAGDVQQLCPSRDGARVVAVVGQPGQRQVYVGRVADHGGALSLGGFHTVLPDRYVDVADVGWLDADRIVVLVKTSDTGRAAGRFPLVAAVDGWPGLEATVLTAGLPSDEPLQIAAAPGGHRLLVSVGGQIWGSASGIWQPLAVGEDPAYGAPAS
jgi:hypothetical protein